MCIYIYIYIYISEAIPSVSKCLSTVVGLSGALKWRPRGARVGERMGLDRACLVDLIGMRQSCRNAEMCYIDFRNLRTRFPCVCYANRYNCRLLKWKETPVGTSTVLCCAGAW